MQKIYTASVNLESDVYENCQTITRVDLMQTPWVGNSMAYAFKNCQSLQSVTNINQNVTNLSKAFQNCRSLSTAPSIPSNVINISLAFENCISLVTPPSIPSTAIYMSSTFSFCNNLTTPPTLPENVHNLNETFLGCSKLATIPTIPASITTSDLILTFFGCTNLKTHTQLPANITYLYKTFLGCSNIETIPAFPENIYYMSETYYGCSSLVTIPNIPYNAKTLYHTFGACVNISGDLNILSDQVTNVTNLFGETSLRKNVYIPPVCYNDTSVNSPTYNAFITAGYDNIGTKDGVYLMYNYSPVLPSDWETTTAANGTTILEKYIGANTTVITPHNDWYSNKALSTETKTGDYTYKYAFRYNKNIISVDLANVECVNNSMASAFAQCNGLQSVTNMSQNIINMDSAFLGCNKLTVIPSIPDSVINMYRCFEGCSNINTLPHVSENVQNLAYCFRETAITNANIIAYNAIDTTSILQMARVLTDVNLILPNTQSLRTGLDNDTRVKNASIVAPNCTDITNIFYGCTNLTNVYAEFNSISNISRLFNNCQSLQSVNLSAQAATNCAALFKNCKILSNTTWNISSCLNLSEAFYECTSLIDCPTLPTSVIDIRGCFKYCNHITDAPIIPNSVTNISSAFLGCSNLINGVNIPGGVTYIGEIYRGCSNLINVPGIGENVTDAYRAFYGCSNLANVPTLPSRLNNLEGMFDNCYRLATISNIPTTAVNMYGTFSGCNILTGNIYIESNQVSNVINCFRNTYITKNVYIPFEYENGVNTTTRNSFEAAYPINTISGTTQGTLTDDNGVISGFSTSNYITSNISDTYQAGDVNNFEISMKITTPTSWTSNGRIINWNGGADSTYGPYIEATTSSIGLIFYNGTDWFGFGALDNPSSATEYFVKWIYDGTTISSYYKTPESINWTLTRTSSISASNVKFTRTDFTLGSRSFDLSPVCVWNGSIDLKECYVKINSKNVWNGYVRPNGVVLKDIDGSKITINPTPADATVLMYSEAAGKEIDEDVLNKFTYIKVSDDVTITGLNTTDTAIVVPSIWTETTSMRAIDGSVIHYKVFKDGYDTVESEITVDGSQTINVNLEQTMCTYTIVSMPQDATVTLTTPDITYRHLYCWGSEYTEYPDLASVPDDIKNGTAFRIYDATGQPVYYYDSFYDTFANSSGIENGVEWVHFDGAGAHNICYRNPENDVVLTVPAYPQEGNSITVPWGTEVSYTVSKAHYTTATGTEIVKTTSNRFIPLIVNRYTFTINPTPADATVQILVNGRLANASSSDWVFTANNANGDIELQEYTGSNTVVSMPTSFETTNTITAEYGSSIEWKVSKDQYFPETGTLILEQDTVLNVELGIPQLNVTDYNYTYDNGIVVLTRYKGPSGEVNTPEVEKG